MKILITGATGNVGRAIIKNFSYNPEVEIFAGVRNTEQTHEFISYDNVTPVLFDFENITTIKSALDKVDAVFFMRPPQLADAKNIFSPFISAMQEKRISYVVFLSVQGADKNKRIPHARIEKMIQDSGITYSIIRPAYFMQNLLTTLKNDLLNRKRIFLPADDAVFNWIDVNDIAKCIVKILDSPTDHLNSIYTLTGSKNHSFYYVAEQITRITGIPVEYKNPGLLKFIIEKKKDNMSWSMIMVMLMLHFLPRWQKPPEITDEYTRITGQVPNDLNTFIKREIAPVFHRKFEYA